MSDSHATGSRAAIGRWVTRLGVRIMRIGVRIENRPIEPLEDEDGMVAT